MTRHTFVLVNAVSGQIVARGPQTNLRRQRPVWVELYARWQRPFRPEIRLAPRLELVTAAREAGAL